MDGFVSKDAVDTFLVAAHRAVVGIGTRGRTAIENRSRRPMTVNR